MIIVGTCTQKYCRIWLQDKLAMVYTYYTAHTSVSLILRGGTAYVRVRGQRMVAVERVQGGGN